MKLTIKCTKEHLKKALYCGTSLVERLPNKDFSTNVGSNCWIAVACHDVFPFCDVSEDYISNEGRIETHFDGKGCPKLNPFEFRDEMTWKIELPFKAIDMIKAFDSAIRQPSVALEQGESTIEFEERKAQTRLQLKPFEFEVVIPKESLNLILKYNDFNLDSFKKIINKTSHLQYVE